MNSFTTTWQRTKNHFHHLFFWPTKHNTTPKKINYPYNDLCNLQNMLFFVRNHNNYLVWITNMVRKKYKFCWYTNRYEAENLTLGRWLIYLYRLISLKEILRNGKHEFATDKFHYFSWSMRYFNFTRNRRNV